MFSLFQRKKAPPADAPTLPDDLLRPESAASLLATPHRRRLLEHIWQRTSVSRAQFDLLYRAPLERYAELVQHCPASESHHHAYPGGMLDHGLEVVVQALKLRQSRLLPAGAPPEAQADQADAWTAGVAYAALLHDLGKLAVDLHVEHADGTVWHPWHGPLRQPYRLRYRKGREYRLHGAAAGLLYTRVLDGRILDWLSGFPDLWAALLYVLAGQYEHAGVLGELVTQADQASVALALGGDPAKALAAPKHALQRKLLDGLRYLLKEELKLNHPQASDGWLTQDTLWLVSKTVSDKLRAHLLSQGMEGIPASNTAVFNILQEHGIAQATPDGKAIWKATVTSDGGWSHSFTFLRLSPALIWEASERPAPFSGTVCVDREDDKETSEEPETVSAAEAKPAMRSQTPEADGVDLLLNLLDVTAIAPEPASVEREEGGLSDEAKAAEHSLPDSVPSSGDPSGAHFVDWLRGGIQEHRIVINDAKALVHTVADSVFLVSPGVFQRYAQEHPGVTRLAKQEKLSDWEWVQKQFEHLRLHRKQPDGLNIWTCEVAGPRKSRKLHGYLLAEGAVLFDEMPPNNPYLGLM